MSDIGKWCILRLKRDGSLASGIVIDHFPGGRAKRIRLQSGEHAGEVRIPFQYDLLEFVDSANDAKTALATAFSELVSD